MKKLLAAAAVLPLLATAAYAQRTSDSDPFTLTGTVSAVLDVEVVASSVNMKAGTQEVAEFTVTTNQPGTLTLSVAPSDGTDDCALESDSTSISYQMELKEGSESGNYGAGGCTQTFSEAVDSEYFYGKPFTLGLFKGGGSDSDFTGFAGTYTDELTVSIEVTN